MALQASGSCSVMPDGLAACSAAAAELGLSDITAVDGGQSGVIYDPPGCYLEGGLPKSLLKYNAGHDNTGACSSFDQCICCGCADCAPGRFTDPATWHLAGECQVKYV